MDEPVNETQFQKHPQQAAEPTEAGSPVAAADRPAAAPADPAPAPVDPAPAPVDPAPAPVGVTKQPAEPAPRSAPPAPVRAAATADGDLRASDADRDRIADILRDALAEGRLDTAEHSERLDRVYAAKTLGELQPLVRDLPSGRTAVPQPAPAAPRPYVSDGGGDNPKLVGILGGAERKGRWRVGNRITAVAIMGGVEIDLTEATFTAPELVIHCTSIMGGISIRLPENVTLRGGGVVGIMGGSDIKAYESPDPGAPVVRVDGFAFWGGVEAKAKRGKKIKDWTKKHLQA